MPAARAMRVDALSVLKGLISGPNATPAIFRRALFPLAPAERYFKSANPCGFSACVDSKTEKVYEKGCARGAFDWGAV